MYVCLACTTRPVAVVCLSTLSDWHNCFAGCFLRVKVALLDVARHQLTAHSVCGARSICAESDRTLHRMPLQATGGLLGLVKHQTCITLQVAYAAHAELKAATLQWMLRASHSCSAGHYKASDWTLCTINTTRHKQRPVC